MACMYQLTFPNGKSYIGITVKTAEKRAQGHRCLANTGGTTAVACAIRKYGTFEIKTLVVADIEYLKELEIKAIAAFGTLSPNGYNIGLGGDTSPMLNPAIGARSKGNKYAVRTGKPPLIRSEEYKRKQSASKMGNKYGIGNKNTVGKTNAAGKRTPEQCARIKAAVIASYARRAAEKGGA